MSSLRRTDGYRGFHSYFASFSRPNIGLHHRPGAIGARLLVSDQMVGLNVCNEVLANGPGVKDYDKFPARGGVCWRL